MSALDKAFLRAYTKEQAAESARAAANALPVHTSVAGGVATRSFTSGTITIPDKKSTDAANGPLLRSPTLTIGSNSTQASPQIRQDGAMHGTDSGRQTSRDGSWIRIDQAAQAGTSNVAAPHVRFTSPKVPAASESKSDDTATKPASAKSFTNISGLHGLGAGASGRVEMKSEQVVPTPHFRPNKGGTVTGSDHQEPLNHFNDTSHLEDSVDVEAFNAQSRPVASSTSDSNVGVLELPKSREALIQASKATKPRLAAVWEVDSFLWTEFLETALSAGFDHFREAGSELHKACRGGLELITVTSSQRGEGRTTIALCLARSVAATGVRVALVDADLDNPQLAANLGVEPCSGWEDVVRGELPLAETAVFSRDDRITLFPLANAQNQYLTSLSDPRVTNTVRKLKEHFDLVIVDMGPAGTTDRRLFAGGGVCPVDASVVVRDVRLTSREEAFATAAVLKANGVRSVGIVENFV